MNPSATSVGRVLCIGASLCTGTVYLILVWRHLAVGAAPGPSIVFGVMALLTLGAGVAAPYLSVYHVYFVLAFVFVPPALYLLMGESSFRFVALGTVVYFAGGVVLHIGESRSDVA